MAELQDEIRRGCLSEHNHAFLHGEDTAVPGSWCAGRAWCGRKGCQDLARRDECVDEAGGHRRKRTAGQANRKEKIKQNECEFCRRERASKARVASGMDDPRFHEAKFVEAPAIFANNDVKYEANKKRSRLFAEHHNSAMLYVRAQDTPSAEVLRDKPRIAEEKARWLQDHDKHGGNLYGILPLALGMPMALTDHIDRNPEKQLLRGKIGFVHSWVLEDGEQVVYKNGQAVLNKLPRAVFLKFPDAKWTLPGMEEPGLYPIVPRRAKWYLDHGRQHPVLGVTRQQLPLAPAFAVTAHAAQGQTLSAAIVDLQISNTTSPIASYVALTRVKTRGAC